MPRAIGPPWAIAADRSDCGSSSMLRVDAQAPGIEDHRDRARQAETGHALAHGNGDLPVRCRQHLRTEAAPLRAECRESRDRATRRERSGSPSGWTATSGRSWRAGSSSMRATGRAKCSPAEPRSAAGCQGSCGPVVNTAAAPAAAATRTTAPRLPRRAGASNSTTGAVLRSCQDRCAIGLPPPRDRDDAGLGRDRRQLGEHRRRHRVGQSAQLRPDIRREALDQ